MSAQSEAPWVHEWFDVVWRTITGNHAHGRAVSGGETIGGVRSANQIVGIFYAYLINSDALSLRKLGTVFL